MRRDSSTITGVKGPFSPPRQPNNGWEASTCTGAQL